MTNAHPIIVWRELKLLPGSGRVRWSLPITRTTRAAPGVKGQYGQRSPQYQAISGMTW